MKIGFNLLLWTTHVTDEHFPLLDTLKKVGYDGVEIPIFEGDEAHFTKVGQAIKDAGLECTTVTVLPDAEHSAISPDASSRRGAVERLEWALNCSAAVGSKLICGPFHQPLGQFSGSGATEEEKARAAEVHREVADLAQDRGIVMAIEYLNRFECYFLNTLADAAAHVKRVNHPAFGTMYDTFHANIEEKDAAGVIEQHVDAIRHIHISENDRGTPGKGNINWPKIYQSIKASGYDGWLTIEAFGRALPDLAAATCVWRDFFPRAEEVYTEGFRSIKEGMQ